MSKKMTKDQENNAVVTDFQLENEEFPIGKLVHISTATHAWRGTLAYVTPSHYVFERGSASIVPETGNMTTYGTEKTAREYDEKVLGEIRVARAAECWMLVFG